MFGLGNWWRNRLIERDRAGIDNRLWKELHGALPLLEGLSAQEAGILNDLALSFLRDKTFETVKGIELDQRMRLAIALQACLPVLCLGLCWYRGWYALIVYPDQFVPEREWMDEDGVVWIANEPMRGEAWEQGPVILSWADIEAGGVRDGFNVILHELAHKLDMLDGSANGHPPLHAEMSDSTWSQAFTPAYRDLIRRVDGGEDTPIDLYGTESPAEFFAVCSEAFFELPHMLNTEYPAVYEQLKEFYRQDPLRRLPRLARVGL